MLRPVHPLSARPSLHRSISSRRTAPPVALAPRPTGSLLASSYPVLSPLALSPFSVALSATQRRYRAGKKTPMEAFEDIEMTGSFQKQTSKMNTVINVVPQQEAWIIERLGRYSHTLESGLHFLIPFVDRVAYRFSLKEEALIIPNRAAITQDNVPINLVGVLYFRVVDPYKAAYGVGDPIFALSQLAQTTLRSVVGKMSLDDTFHERTMVNTMVKDACNAASAEWGIVCMRHEIREIIPPADVIETMEMQMQAERRKRVDILESEGKRQAEINKAEGFKQALILQSEAYYNEQVNKARGDLEAAKLRAQGIAHIAEALSAPGGDQTVQMEVAMKYIGAFEKLAKTNNTMIVPASTSDLASMIAQSMAVMKGAEGKK